MLNRFSNLVIEEELNKKEFKIYIIAITILLQACYNDSI